MKRERRKELVDRTYQFAAAAVKDLASIDGGLYEGLADINTDEGFAENDLVIDVIRKISDQLYRKGGA